MSDGGAIGATSFLEAPLIETHHGFVAMLLVVWLACVQWLRRCVGQCADGEVQRAHGCCMLGLARLVR